MKALSTKEGIAKQFAGKLADMELLFIETLREAPSVCKHLFDGAQLGAYLEAMAMQLQGPGVEEGHSQANCLLITQDHVMALHVDRKKMKGSDKEYWSAKLYDPNATANYRRVVAENPEDFSKLKLEDLCCVLHCRRSLTKLFVVRFRQGGGFFLTLAS